MKNLFDYLDYYGNVSFKEYGFNDVDSLIFSLLSYVELEGIVLNSSVSMKEACRLFFDKFKGVDFKKKNWLFPNSYKLMEKLTDCKRYSSTFLSRYVNQVNENGQFGALTIRIIDASITYLSYCGTDSNIVGWKEDFDMVCNYPVYSQTKAKEYFNDSIRFWDKNVYVGGHSKGGNLAMFAYMYGNSFYKKRVKKIYNFDGPGFLEDVLSLDVYKEMSSKLVHVVPKDSIVGVLLYHDNYYPVCSSAKSILQHEAYTWECFGGFFVSCELSKSSCKFRDRFYEFLDQMTMDEKQDFVNNLFKVFSDLKITNVMQLKDYSFTDFLSFIKELGGIPSATKRNLISIFRLLLGTIN